MEKYAQYDAEDNTLTIKLSTGGSVVVNFRNATLIYGEGGLIELDFLDDALKDVCFIIGARTYSALQIVQWAKDAADEYASEAAEHAADEAATAEFLSSPYKTGRI